MIKAIFFDTSDTLYRSEDFEKAQSKQPIYQLADLRGISFEAAESLFKETKQSLKATLDHVTKVAVMMELGVSRMEMQEYMARIEAHDFLSPDPKLGAMLDGLSRDYDLGIVSNILERAVRNVLEALEVSAGVFQHFVTVNNTDHSKPHAEPFLKAVELSGFSPEEIVYVGDSLTKDMIPAKKAGLKTIWITQEREASPEVDATIESLHDLGSTISKL